jgi:undecaprenyl diphosphate synthase
LSEFLATEKVSKLISKISMSNKLKSLWLILSQGSKQLVKGFAREKPAMAEIITPKPDHVAVIMDGNGRWANSQGLSRIAGHKRGVDSVKALIKSCLHHQIPYLSIFAFSSENWDRPEAEVNALMELLGNALETQTSKLNENGVRLKLLGDMSRFSEKIQALALAAQAATAANDKLVFNVAINYGGRWDVAQACRKLAKKVADGQMLASDITEDAISNELSTSGMPDPDLFIRTSGEYRISNFLLWQAAYSEFYFTDVLWPDFNEQEFTDALVKYTNRNRRYGNAVETIAASAGNQSNSSTEVNNA